MSAFVFDLPIPSVPIAGSDLRFPVRRIYCVGRNYAAHAREMGIDPAKEPPVFFMKPGDAVFPEGGRYAYPGDTAELHHEVELVIALGRGGDRIPAEAALNHVFGYAVGIDLTKRDRQAEAKAKGQPWERAKAFELSAPISMIVMAAASGHPTRGRIGLAVNGLMRQEADLADMILSPAEIIAHLSRLWTLEAGDLIFTGTPEGVGALAFGDQVEARVEGVGGLRLEITSG
jgi:fumarylpyruvate hydrolase